MFFITCLCHFFFAAGACILDSGIYTASKNQTQASQKPTLFWMDTKPVLPELKTIAKTKYSVAKIAIPDSSSDTLLSL